MPLLLTCLLGLALPAVAAGPKAAVEPKTAAEYVTRALRRIDTWQWSEALADAAAALRREPRSARAMLAKGAANVGINPAAALRDLAEAGRRGEKSARLYCEQGLAYCALKRYDKAVEAAEQALKIAPQEARAYGLRGQALAAWKGLNAALPDLEKAVALAPNSAYGHGVRAETIMDWDVNLGPPPPEIQQLMKLNPHYPIYKLPSIMAMRPLRAAIALDPDNPRYYYDRGCAFSDLGNDDKAMSDQDRAIALNPAFFRAYFQRMHLWVSQRDFKAGNDDAVRMIQLDPSDYAGHHAHGYYLVMTGHEEEGLKEINLAIQADPAHAIKDYLVRALVRLRQQKPTETVADATKALEINPRNPDAHYVRARAFIQLQEWRRAIADFDVMIRIAPEVVEHWTWRAEAKARLGDYRGGAADYGEALKVIPHFAPASFLRGDCRMHLRDFEGAAADFRDALAHGVEHHHFDDRYDDNCPGHAAAHRGLGQILLAQHKPKEARAEFDQALEIDPRDAFTLERRGKARHELHDYRGAIADFNRAIESNPRCYSAYIGRGFSKYELRDCRGAVADFDAALRLYPSAANAYAGRGMVKSAMDDCEGALADLDTAIRQARNEAEEETGDPAGRAPPPAAAVAEETSGDDADNPFSYLLGQEGDAGASTSGELPRGLLSDIYHNRGLTYCKTGQYVKAIKDYDQAFRIWPPTDLGLMTRAHAKGYLGDWPGLVADAGKALAINPKCQWARCDRAVRASLDGDFAGALAILNRVVEDYPAAAAPRLYRGVLLDALDERELALADYRTALKDTDGSTTCNADQAALAIWTIRGFEAQRAEADRDLRKHFAGRKPDLKGNWYCRLAAFLLDPADSEAALVRDAQSADHLRTPCRQAGAYYYAGVRRRLGGDKSGAVEMMKKAAATSAVTELQWYESELRLRIATGKISSPQQPRAGPWRKNLPQPAKHAADR